MKCAWKELLAILPEPIRCEMERFEDCCPQEIRLRLDKPPEWIGRDGIGYLNCTVTERDLQFVVNTASRYSPWAATTMRHGYLTAPGGHRIGLCGEVYAQAGDPIGIRNLTSLNIRISRDFQRLTNSVPMDNLLIIGPPGSGKTTLLRDVTRQLSEKETVTVIDERKELFPDGYSTGRRMDVLTGCGKKDGIYMALRNMGPKWIAVDEITTCEDCDALRGAGWCGVRLLATAHAACPEDLLRRPVYKPLVECGLFRELCVLRPDKSWYRERLG